jgi:hypothetical protein
VTVNDLISAASHGPLMASDLERAVIATGLATVEVLDRVSRRIAEGYVSGEYDFAIADAVMNAIFGYATASTTASVELSKFAWGVYEAFDQGEFRGEDVTKCLIAVVLRRGYLMRGDCS